MKHPNRLVKGLRMIFGALCILIILGLAVRILFMMLPHPPRLDLGKVMFSDDSVSAHIVPDSPAVGKLSVMYLQGTLVLKNAPAGSEILSFAKWATLPHYLAVSIFGILLFAILRRLCRNAERGAIFTEGNVKLVRLLGWNFLGYAILSLGVTVWSSARIGHYLETHIAFEGVKVITIWSHPILVIIPVIGNLVYGLLLLALAEVFRHGLTLKQDTDLTV